MNVSSAKTEPAVFTKLKDYYKSVGLPKRSEHLVDNVLMFDTELKQGKYSLYIRTLYNIVTKEVSLGVLPSYLIPPEKISIVEKLLKLIDDMLVKNQLSVTLADNKLLLQKQKYAAKDTFEIEQFNLLLKDLVRHARNLFFMIWAQMFSSLPPKQFLRQYFKQKKRNKSKQLKESKSKKHRTKPVIHVSSADFRCQYPTHTLGMTEIGLPEIFIDPMAFGAMGNATRVNAIFELFRKPDNVQLLNRILSGEIVELTDEDLSPGTEFEHIDTYCLREVSPNFAAVRLTYGSELKPGMRFIQVWVKGDDFALSDLYYEGGIMW